MNPKDKALKKIILKRGAMRSLKDMMLDTEFKGNHLKFPGVYKYNKHG